MINTLKNKPHVVHIVESLEVGGMENGIVNLVNHMDKDRFKVSICCLSHPGVLADRIIDKNVVIFCMDWRFGFKLDLIFTLAKKLKHMKVDIVHTHGWLSFIYGAIACKLAGVHTLLNGEHGTFNLGKNRRKIAYRLLSIIVDSFLTVSFSLKHEMINSLNIPGNKIVTIPNGVDTTKFCPRNRGDIVQAKEKLGIPVSAQVIGSVGRLEYVKNYDMLIHAFYGISHDFPTLRCLLVGDGSCRKHLEMLVRNLGIESKVHFVGKVENPQDIFPVMDVFVLTSFSEGMSNTILESMSCAKPIIATDVGGNKEMVIEGYNGLLVESKNVTQLKNAIITLLIDNKKRISFGRNSRKIVNETYSMDTMVSAYQNIYSKTIKFK